MVQNAGSSVHCPNFMVLVISAVGGSVPRCVWQAKRRQGLGFQGVLKAGKRGGVVLSRAKRAPVHGTKPNAENRGP